MKQSSAFKKISLATGKKREKNNDKAYLSELECRLQYCLRNLRIACKAIPPGEVKIKIKNGGIN
jgi:hypothetical protein